MTSPAVRTVLFGSAYLAESKAVFAAMTTVPTINRRKKIDTCIRALKAAGVWAQLDALYMLAAADEQASRINWKNPTNSLTAVNAPTFTADRGWDFATTKSLSTGYDYGAGVSGAKYALANAHAFAYCVTNSKNDNRYDLGADTTQSVLINSYAAGSAILGRLNYGTGGDVFGTVSTSIGMSLMNRTNGTNAQYCRDGAVLYDRAVTTSAVPGNIVIGNIMNNDATRYSSRRIGAAGFGGGLNVSQLPAYYNAIYAYLHSVGAV